MQDHSSYTCGVRLALLDTPPDITQGNRHVHCHAGPVIRRHTSRITQHVHPSAAGSRGNFSRHRRMYRAVDTRHRLPRERPAATLPKTRHLASSNIRDSVLTDLQAIAHRRQEWIAAVNARDVARYLELLTPDIVWLPPGQPALSGRRAFESWVRPFFEQFAYEFDITEPDVRIAGDWAVERGAFQTRMKALDDGRSGQHEGRYLVIWRRASDNSWRIERYVDETPAADADG